MRVFAATLVVANFIFSSAIAEPLLAPGKPAGAMQAGSPFLLPPGKPAGIRQAMSTSERKELMIIGVVVLAATGAAIVWIGPKSSSAPTTTSP